MTDKVKRKLGYTPYYGGGSISPFESLFRGGGQNVITDGFEGVSALVLWGGTDIHPSYYGEKAHMASQVYAHPQQSERDQKEWKAMIYAKAHGIPIIGVCRGAQFLCAFAGGRIIQHVRGHVGSSSPGHHPIVCKIDKGQVYHSVTTCHHQMMYPFNVEHELLGYCDDALSNIYEVGPGAPPIDMSNRPEPEVVYFPRVRGFAVQGHPEWMREEMPFVQWMLKNISEKCFDEEYQTKDEYAEVTV